MSDTAERHLRQTLQLRPQRRDILRNRESATLEFKKSFNAGNLARYARTAAAYANTRGGYIVFGVEDSPHRLVGVNAAFDKADAATISTFLGRYLSPEVEWDMGSVAVHNVHLGFMHIQESRHKPVIVLRDSGSELSEGAIFYRYSGQSTAIRAGEMRALIDERMDRERRALLEHLRRIQEIGPTNVGLLDTRSGLLHGGGAPYLIDESLLRQVSMVREGSFIDTGGQPALRVVGEVMPISTFVSRTTVPVAIHMEDLFGAFLNERTLAPEVARSYLRETAVQVTPFVPVFVYAAMARLTAGEAAVELEAVESSFPATRRQLVRRLGGAYAVCGIGVVVPIPANAVPQDVGTWAPTIMERAPKLQRSLALELMRRRPVEFFGVAQGISALRVCEAITHLTDAEAHELRPQVLGYLNDLLTNRYRSLSGNEKTAFRKAVCRMDAALYSGMLEGRDS